MYSTNKALLIVDNNKANRKILFNLLKDEYSVIETGSAQSALETLKTADNRISAVLLEAEMPFMNGYTLINEIRNDNTISQIPIIVTAGKFNADSEEKALSLGANDFILRPYKPAITKHRIANTISLRETDAFINRFQTDELTSLLTKEFFYQKAANTLKDNPSNKYDIICSDIERFKLVNDLFGVTTGDELLKYAAGVMIREIKEGIVFGRVGTDRFACLLPHREKYSDDFFGDLIKNIRRFSHSITFNIKFGIYNISDISMPVSAMCDRALLACNAAKGLYGVDFSYYDDSVRRKLLSEKSILDAMKGAINSEEFKVYYQPKYEIATGRISGAEALVRWIHPQKGMILPGVFIPVLEKSGYITQLDMFVWENVCKAISEWKKGKKKIVPISVNVSRADVNNANLPYILKNLLNKYEISPHYIHLEITESAYTKNPTQLVEVVRKLKSLGFIIEMDDFGAGYSSLNMLSSLPLDILKLDMNFIRSETSKSGNKNILSFIISLAKWLNLPVVAEGVENEEQLAVLKGMDCEYAQGFYFAEALSAEEFNEYISRSQIIHPDKSAGTQKASPDNKIMISKSKSERIMMIVDDVELNRKILSEMFRGIYTIAEAQNGQDAYDFIKKHYDMIDIVLMDLVMPVMNGFQLMAKLKQDSDLRNIPIIVTSQITDGSEARALSMGADDFIAKPYNTDVALHRVSNVMAQSKLKIIEREKVLADEVKAMRYKAEHDALTGLYNRTVLESMVNSFFSDNSGYDGCFIMLDIDNFKSVNDILGHDKGDEVLIDIANIISNCFRKSDVVSRLGGDEFAIFMPSLFSVDMLKKRLSLLCEKLSLKYDGITLSASIGASVAPQQGTDYATLYKNADSALIAAKRLGKNQYRLFDDNMEMPSPVLSRNIDWLLDETSDGIIVCDMSNYNVLYLNRGICEITGKSRKDCMGKKCYELLWNRTQPCEHCIQLKESSEKYCEHEIANSATGKQYIIKGKLTEWGGKPARIQFIQDNTSRAAVAKKLAEISTDRKRLLDLMPGGIFRYSALRDDRFDFISENMLSMLGYTREEFIKKFRNSFKNMIWHEDRQRVLSEISSQIAVGDTDECEYRIEKADGSLCFVHDVGRVVYDDDGNPWYYVTIIDVTKEHNATAKLEEEHKKLQIAISHAGLTYWEYDLINDVCIGGSDNVTDLLTQRKAEYHSFLNQSGIIPPEYLDFYKEKHLELLSGKTYVEYDIPLCLPAGNALYRIRCTNIFNENNKPIKAVCTAEKIK